MENFCNASPKITYLVSLSLRPAGVSGAVEIDLPLAFPIIDLLLGGPGRAESSVREITEIEEQILETVVKVIARELETTWHPVLEMQFVFDQRLRQSDISRLMPPNEKVLSLSFEIRMPEARGMLNVALPAAVSNALLRKLTQLASYRKQRGTADSTSQIREHIEHCVYFLSNCSLPEAPRPRIPTSVLERGDVLKLGCSLSESADLLVSGKKMFRAYPVRSGTRRAAQVDKRISTSSATYKESV